MENTIAQWKETVDLSFELTDTMFVLLDTLMDYCKKHNIPLYQERGMWNLVNRAQGIFRQIEAINPTTFPKLTDEKKHPFRTDEEGTEPYILDLKHGLMFIEIEKERKVVFLHVSEA